MVKLLVIVRFFYTALLLILTEMVVPQFEPGNRVVILIDAAIAAILIWLIRQILGRRVSRRWIGFWCGLGLPAGMFIAQHFFAGINLAGAGILFAYLGEVGLEWLLPGQLRLEALPRGDQKHP